MKPEAGSVQLQNKASLALCWFVDISLGYSKIQFRGSCLLRNRVLADQTQWGLLWRTFRECTSPVIKFHLGLEWLANRPWHNPWRSQHSAKERCCYLPFWGRKIHFEIQMDWNLLDFKKVMKSWLFQEPLRTDVFRNVLSWNVVFCLNQACLLSLAQSCELFVTCLICMYIFSLILQNSICELLRLAYNGSSVEAP